MIDIRDEWRIRVASLERSNRSLSTCIDGLRYTCESLLRRIEVLENYVADKPHD